MMWHLNKHTEGILSHPYIYVYIYMCVCSLSTLPVRVFLHGLIDLLAASIGSKVLDNPITSLYLSRRYEIVFFFSGLSMIIFLLFIFTGC